jgi:hypothetical protein
MTTPPSDPVDAEAYAAHLDRLDRIGRDALAADPAEAITLVREANDLVAELLPMHRRLMAELAEHRATLQSACEELEQERAEDPGGPVTSPEPRPRGAADQLDRLDGIGDQDAPF